MNDCAEHAFKDTLYSIGKLIKICVPLYPKDATDAGPVVFTQAVVECLSEHFQWDDDVKLFAGTFIQRYWMCLFANLFCMKDVLTLWVYLIEPDTDKQRYYRLCAFTLEMLKPHASVFAWGGARAFSFLSSCELHNVDTIILNTQKHGTAGKWR
ncbi:hypothetical protein OAU26_03725 [Mariniblastus sp.]|nr:hypothetical protein [Mariniblastus sp.]